MSAEPRAGSIPFIRSAARKSRHRANYVERIQNLDMCLLPSGAVRPPPPDS